VPGVFYRTLARENKRPQAVAGGQATSRDTSPAQAAGVVNNLHGLLKLPLRAEYPCCEIPF